MLSVRRFAAVMLSGPAVLVGLGLLVALGEVARSVITDRAARRGTPRQRGSRLQSLGRHVAAAAVTIGPASLVGRVVQGEIGGHIGALVGVVAANLMFGLPPIAVAHHARGGVGLLMGEFIATFGLLATIWGCARSRPSSQ